MKLKKKKTVFSHGNYFAYNVFIILNGFWTRSQSQQCFPDGSFSDVTLVVDLRASNTIKVSTTFQYNLQHEL